MNFKKYMTSQISRSVPDQSIIFKFISYPFSVVFFVLVFIRNKLYDFGLVKSYRLTARFTWSVGNISVGGTGKTPFEVWLLQTLLTLKPDLKVVVLSRGYGSKLGKNEYAVYKDGHLTELYSDHFFDPMADEARLVSKQCPHVMVVVGRRRRWAYETFLEASKFGPVDLVVLDDGLQHRSIVREVDFLILPKDKPLGNGRMAPSGILREFPTMLKSRNIVSVLVDGVPCANSKEVTQFNIIGGEYFTLGRSYKNIEQAKVWCGEQNEIVAVLGIARSTEVVRNWMDLGLKVQLDRSVFLDDHQELSADLFETLRMRGSSILTTEKDFYRNQDFFKRLGVAYFVVEQELVDMTGKLSQWLKRFW